MISKECFTSEWISQKSAELKYNDKNLIEKVIRAFALLEMLAASGCPFCFKGGTSLMLVLGGGLHRLSIDVDILCPFGTNIEDYLHNYAQSGFIDYRLVERRPSITNIPKSHSKFFYQVSFKGQTDETSYILLDVVYGDNHYQKTNIVDIINPLIKVEGNPLTVSVPSVDDLLADKLTAFAPETTGIPYTKNGKSTTLEIIKQLYDVGRLFDQMNDVRATSRTFKAIVDEELRYRNLTCNISSVINDIRNTALNISTRGFVDKDKFALLQKGIINIKPYIYKSAYRIEEAITDSAKVAYLCTAIEKNVSTIERYDTKQVSADLTIDSVFTNKLNKLRIALPEAYYYWALASRL